MNETIVYRAYALLAVLQGSTGIDEGSCNFRGVATATPRGERLVTACQLGPRGWLEVRKSYIVKDYG